MGIKKNEVLLSVAIPTLNRRKLLEITLSQLIPQIDKYNNIELIVSDNCSTDDTHLLFENNGKFLKDNITYRRFDEKVDADNSFKRTVDLTNGKYVVLFGDDDIPLPGFIDEVIKTLIKYSEISILYVNRIVGDENMQNCSFIPHINQTFGTYLYNISDFIKEFTHWPGFVTCLIFSKKLWNNTSDLISDFSGYDFLFRIYLGSKDSQACFLASPLILQRRGIQSWKKFWPTYWLVSMPGLLSELEKKDVTQKALEHWQLFEVSEKRFFIDNFVAKAYGYSINSDFWIKSRKFQKSKKRKIISIFIQFLLPVFIAKFIYSKSNKMT